MCAGGEEGGDECGRCEGEVGECVLEVRRKRESVCRRCEGEAGRVCAGGEEEAGECVQEV